MGVSSTVNRVVDAGDGSTTTFGFPYYFFNLTDLKVYIYDSLAGGITPLTLGTDYNISATANFQGFYPSGGNIVCTAAPANTALIVIDRNTPQIQNFAILENGVIPSAALIQQFDYITLILQRLQELASRSIYLPDGMGEAFNGALPSNLALMPLSFLQVNAAGNGWQLSNTSAWQSATIPYSDLTASSTSQAIEAFSIPAGFVLTALAIKHSQSFAGPSITDVVAEVGVSGSSQLFFPSFDVFQSVGDTKFDNEGLDYIGSWANPTPVYINFVSTGADVNVLTAGEVTLYYQIQAVG